MKPRLRLSRPVKIFVPLAALLLGLAFSGCNDSRAAADTPEPHPACTYKEGAGLELSPAGRSFLNLQTAEFDGRKVPADALLRTARGDYVYVVNGDRFLRTPVKSGRPAATGVEIKEGLYEGDVVVVGGVRGLWLAELQAVNGGVGCADGH